MYLESDGTGRLHDVVNAPGVKVTDLLVETQLDQEFTVVVELVANTDVAVDIGIGVVVCDHADHEVCPDVKVEVCVCGQSDHEDWPGIEP